MSNRTIGTYVAGVATSLLLMMAACSADRKEEATELANKLEEELISQQMLKGQDSGTSATTEPAGGFGSPRSVPRVA